MTTPPLYDTLARTMKQQPDTSIFAVVLAGALNNTLRKETNLIFLVSYR